VKLPETEILDEVRSFIPNLLHACDTVSALLYKPVTSETWTIFGDLVQGMDDLYRTLRAILADWSEDGQASILREHISVFVDKMYAMFKELNTYMDDEAFAEAGDCLFYELSPLFAELS